MWSCGVQSTWIATVHLVSASDRWQAFDTNQVYHRILVMRASYYSSVSLHSELIASGVIMTDLGSVLTCLTNVDNSIWIVLLNG